MYKRQVVKGGDYGHGEVKTVYVGVTAPEPVDVQVLVKTDRYPTETSWELKRGNTVIASAERRHYTRRFREYTDNYSVTGDSDDAFTFTIRDSYGDGICCGYGRGAYSVKVNGNEVASGGAYKREESTTFQL